jgi:hypothetical protein
MQLLSSVCHFQTLYSDSGTRWEQKPQQCNFHCYFPQHLLHPEKFQPLHAPETEPNNKLVVSHNTMKSSQVCMVGSNSHPTPQLQGEKNNACYLLL